jgi:pumilio homology domain family member 6
MEALLEPVGATYPAPDESNPHPIDLPHTSRMYKSLLQGGHFSQKVNSVIRSPAFSPSAFASTFIKIVGRETTLAMAKGSGTFLVVELCQRLKEEGDDKEKTEVRAWFTAEKIEELRAGNAKGTSLLSEKIDTLS